MAIAEWQKDLLDDGELLREGGKAEFMDWETAEKNIAGRFS